MRKYRSESFVEEWKTEDGPGIRRAQRKARLHAFDVEAGVFVLFFGARAGFSPGEFFDFLVGWFGFDPANDDDDDDPRAATSRQRGRLAVGVSRRALGALAERTQGVEGVEAVCVAVAPDQIDRVTAHRP